MKSILIKPDDCSVPAFDTTRIHASAAVRFALESSIRELNSYLFYKLAHPAEAKDGFRSRLH